MSARLTFGRFLSALRRCHGGFGRDADDFEAVARDMGYYPLRALVAARLKMLEYGPVPYHSAIGLMCRFLSEITDIDIALWAPARKVRA